MAQTKRDAVLKLRIEGLIKQNPQFLDKDMIHLIAGVCRISQRCASEHFHSFKSQQKLLEIGFKEECIHHWSSPFSTPGGLMKECVLCSKTEEVKV